MSNYFIKKTRKQFCVMEQATKHTIKCFKSQTDANIFLKKYNIDGIGFDGWTPQFMLKKSTVSFSS